MGGSAAHLALPGRDSTTPPATAAAVYYYFYCYYYYRGLIRIVPLPGSALHLTDRFHDGETMHAQ